MNLETLRQALAAHFDQTITPAVAASICERACQMPDRSHDPAKFGSQNYNGYTIQAERFVDVLDELHPLHEAHWLETERHRHGFALNPDYSALLADERAGTMLQFTARHGGAIVAHLRIYIGVSRHTQTLFSQEDTLFVTPEHRGGFLVMQLMRFAEAVLRHIGVVEIRADSKLINRADVLMRRLGYEPVALQFVKIFKE